MTQPMPTPQVIRRFDRECESSPLPVTSLRWEGQGEELNERVWNLPDGVTIQGPPPRTLGYRILRQGNGAFSLRLIWDRTHLEWESLSRDQLLSSCLRPLLATLGKDLWHTLDRAGPGLTTSPNYAA